MIRETRRKIEREKEKEISKITGKLSIEYSFNTRNNDIKKSLKIYEDAFIQLFSTKIIIMVILIFKRFPYSLYEHM